MMNPFMASAEGRGTQILNKKWAMFRKFAVMLLAVANFQTTGELLADYGRKRQAER
jgi:hypothetical protein